MEAVQSHVASLPQAAQSDVDDIRAGLPKGAEQLVGLWEEADQNVREEEKEISAKTGDAGVADEDASAKETDSSDGGVSDPKDSGVDAPMADATADADAPKKEPKSRRPGMLAQPAPGSMQGALDRAREKVQELRVAKSTFFALADTRGTVLRNDQDQDLMVGKGLFAPFPALKQALRGKYVETTGSMDEAATINNRPDAQWVAANPITLNGTVRGLYVTGWGWSAYARRLQLAVRSEVQDQVKPGQNEPLVYVIVLVEDRGYGWDVPNVTLDHVTKLNIKEKLGNQQVYAEVAELTGRKWGIAAQHLPAFTGVWVAAVVVRSET